MVAAVDQRGEGDPLVLLHGVGTQRVIWRRVRPLLAARRRVVTLDLPGFGEAAPAGEGFELAAVAERVGQELDAAGVGSPFDLVGHSLGGAVALSLARSSPDLVRRLVLVAPAGMRPWPRLPAAALGLAAEGFLTARRALGAPLAGHPLGRRALLIGAVHDGARLPPAEARAMLEASRGASRTRGALAEAATVDLRWALADLRPPLGLLWGECDRVVPPAAMRALLAARPGTPSVTIPLTGHVPMMEEPEAFTRGVEELLDRLAITPR